MLTSHGSLPLPLFASRRVVGRVASDGGRDLFAAHFYDPDGHLVSLSGWVDGS